MTRVLLTFAAASLCGCSSGQPPAVATEYDNRFGDELYARRVKEEDDAAKARGLAEFRAAMEPDKTAPSGSDGTGLSPALEDKIVRKVELALAAGHIAVDLKRQAATEDRAIWDSLDAEQKDDTILMLSVYFMAKTKFAGFVLRDTSGERLGAYYPLDGGGYIER